MTSTWHRQQSLAAVDSTGRRSILDLTRPAQPPVVLEGSALEVFDAIDGTRSTSQIVAVLAELHPTVPDLDQHVRSCLTALADLGLVRQSTTHQGT